MSPQILSGHESALSSLSNISDTAMQIPPDEKEKQVFQCIYDVSPAQKRLWILDQLNPQDTAYNLLISLKISGSLDSKILNQALNLIVHNHESLRANIIKNINNNQLEQCIARHKKVFPEYHDYSHEDNFHQKLKVIFNYETNYHFNLETDNLFRFSLIKISDTEHVFIVNIHHIVTDGWSMSNFTKELGQNYKAIIEKDLAGVSIRPVSFEKIIQDKLNYLKSNQYQTELDYWTQQLKGSHNALEFNHSKPSTIDTVSGKRFFFKIDSVLSRQLKDLALKQGVTLNMLLMAQFFVLLNRYTQQTDIAIGSPVAARNNKDEFNSIGFFVNSLVFRETIFPEMSFPDFLSALKKTSIEALKYQDVPFINLVEALNPERSSATNPLYNVSFAFQNMQMPEQKYGALSFELINLDHIDDDEYAWLESDTGHALFDLTLELIQTHKHSLAAAFEYNTRLFDEKTISDMSVHFINILTSLCATPEQKISQISLLSETEKNQQLMSWNDSCIDFKQPLATVPALFMQQAKQTPDNIALIMADTQLTYRELDERSNQLAHYLLARGIVPDTLVAISINRSIEMVIAILGILKAGAAYLPLDPAYPQERLIYMLEDSRAAYLLTSNELLQQFSDSYTQSMADILTLDTLADELSLCSRDSVPCVAQSQHLAFVIYTSGSTGAPKGVCLEHHNLSNLLLSMLQEPGMTASDRWLAVTAISFDIHAMELYLPLLSGAAVVIADQNMVKDAVAIERELNTQGITIMQATPVTWKMLIANGWQAKTPLRIISGGESMGKNLVKALVDQKNIELWNMYGPSETCVYSTRYKLPAGQYHEILGTAIANTRLYVLDPQMNFLPAGQIGELYIAGEGVTRGYLSGKVDRSVMTDERFIYHSFEHGKEERLYRTGDECRYLDNGQLELLGRIDNQVKIRGFRIELGEIETQINRVDGINESVVIVKKDQSDTNQLFAYLKLEPGDENTDGLKQLKNELLKNLPVHMVPVHFMVLECFPQTPSGKIDKKALPDFTVQTKKEFIAPQTELQQQLADIWSEILSVKKISIDDNFFDLGGHSLLATQLVSQLHVQLHLELSLKSIFDYPSIGQLSEYLASDKQSAGKALNPDVVQEIKPSDINNNHYPLSFSQSRLWFIQNLDSRSIAYTMPAMFNLQGKLNIKALESAFLNVIKRHEMLRVHFIEQDEQVFQSIYEVQSWSIAIADDQCETQSEQLQNFIDDFFNTPFDLSCDPLLRTQIVQLSQQHHLLMVNMHHIISDGWSVTLLMSELNQYYNAYINNETVQLELPAIQYTDYAAWQQIHLSGDYLDQELSFWKKKLEYSVTVEVCPDFPRPLKQSFQGDSVSCYIGPEITNKLKEIMHRDDLTLFMTLLTGLNVLLKHYSAQDDICIGTSIANRNNQQLQNVLGFFANTLVLRQKIDVDSTLQQLLQAVKATTLEAYEHQDTPFEKIIDVLDLDHSLSHTPLFQIMFVLQNQQSESLDFNDLLVEFQPYNNHSSKFDLTFNIEELRDGLEINLEFNTALYHKETIINLLKHYETVLKAMCSDLEQRVDQVSLLSLMEKKKILFDFNQTDFLSDDSLSLHQLIEKQALEVPQEYAVVFNHEHISYQELNEKANQLAVYILQKKQFNHELTDHAEPKKQFVGILMDRSINMIIAILATLKAGAAYVPIDANYPAERIEYMLNDSQMGFILSSESLKSQLLQLSEQVQHDFQFFLLDSQWHEISHLPGVNIPVNINGDDLAYMIYTSGSTGQPKGVLCHHKGLVNLLNDYNHKQAIKQGEHCSSWSTFSFDASVYEIFSALCAGGVLHIMDESIRTDSLKVIEFLHEFKINHCFFPALFLPQLLQWLNENSGQLSLKRMMTGVESIDETLLCAIQKRLHDLQIINSYGPTEATIICLAYMIDDKKSSQENAFTAAPIGKPVENTQIYILDKQKNPVPIGVKGEIYVGGEGVTQGYWNNDSLTAEKFIPNVFAPNKSSKLYRTGDIARFLADGNVQFIGRSDKQIKLRGYRIEPGEIETHLKALAVVSEAYITLVNTSASKDGRYLLAYVSLDLTQHINSEAIDSQYFREQLSSLLPAYMIPGRFIILDELPLLPNGKLNKHALPEPGDMPAIEYQAAQTDEQLILCKIWSEQLEISGNIGINDNFFELGGHSLIAARIMTRINNTFNTQLQIMQLFERPTIAQLSRLIADNAINKASTTIGQKIISLRNSNEVLPLSFSQERIWFLEQYDMDANNNSRAYNIPIVLKVEGGLNIELLEKSFQLIIQRHENLRTCFNEDDAGQLYTEIHQCTDWKMPVQDLRQYHVSLQVSLRSQLINDMVQESFDLANDHLFSVSLVLLGDNEFLLLINLHHIIADGWSMGVLLKEIKIIYSALLKDEKLSIDEFLPQLTIQYADFSIWQRNQLETADIQQQFSYWHEQLADINTLELPTDKTRPPVQTFNGAHHLFTLSKQKTTQIKQLCQQYQVSPFMFFMTVFNVMLYRYTNQKDICVGTPVAGRNQQQTEELIGLFVNSLAIRSSISSQLSFQQLLEQIKYTTLQAYANQDVPFDRVVESLNLQRNLSTTPVFQTMLVMQNSPISSLEFADLKLIPQTINNPTAKFDLLLDISEHDNEYQLSFEYNTDLFYSLTMEKMATRFELLIDSGCLALEHNSALKLIEMNFLEQQEIDQQLLQWQSKDKYLAHSSVHEMFEAQVHKTPGAIAIRYNRQAMDYQSLNAKANQLARYLQQQGIKRGDQVGICLGRSFEMIIAVLAVVKTGACYLPMDISYPEQRLKYMLDEVQSPLLITDSIRLSALSFDAEKTFIIDQQGDLLVNLASANLQAETHQDDAFYTIFTSGSTGRPKGASVSHLCEINMLDWYTRTDYKMTVNDRVLIMSAFGFDLSQKNIFAPLTCGASLILPEFEEYDPRLLTALIQREQVSWTSCTPSALNPLVDDADFWYELTSLRYVFFGGEPLKIDKMKAWQQQSQCRLINTYGPTECTDIAAYHELSDLNDYEDRNIPIGKANANVGLYIVDENLNLLAPGMTGEICITGASVGLGYIKQPELNKEKFVDNPFAGKNTQHNSCSVLYRTGDLGRYQDDKGNIEHMGRIDFQTKLRGLRIELGEIEYALQQYDGVKESLVRVVDGQIIAWLTTDIKIEQDKLKQSLAAFLPQYMIPLHFILLEAFPLTQHGKIDRQALPEFIAESHSDFIAPETEIQQQLQKIWTQVLFTDKESDKIGIKDDFFSLGGNSLQAAQIIARIRTQYQIDVPVKRLFTEPTIAALSIMIEQAINNNELIDDNQIQSIQRVNRVQEDSILSANELNGNLFDDSSAIDESEEEFEI